MKTVLLSLFLLFVGNSIGQSITISGKVSSFDGTPMSEASVIDQNGALLGTTDISGNFTNVKVQLGERFGIDKEGFELQWVKVNKEMTNYTIVLDVKVQEIETVVITRRNSEEALDLKNVNIIHYQPLDGAILTLKKEKGTYYIGMDSLRKEGASFPLNITRPRELYFDCMKHAYVLSDDSAYQFVLLDTGLMTLPAISLEVFRKYVSPCVAKFEDRIVMQELRSYNKEYELIMYDDQKPRTIYNHMDQLGYQAAYEASVGVGMLVDPNNGDTLVDPNYLRRQERRKVYGRHDTGPDFQRSLERQEQEWRQQDLLAAQTFNRPDSLGIFNYGNSSRSSRSSTSFGSQDAWRNTRNWEQSMASYMLFMEPIGIRTYQVGSFIAVVDFQSSKVDILDHYGYPIKESSFEIASDIKNVMQDKATGAIYLYARDKGNHKIFGLDPFTGRTTYLKNFGGMPHTEQAIIYDGYLYYKVLERDFYGINRVRLPSSIFYAEE